VTGRQEPGEPLRNAVNRRRGGQLILYLPAEGGHVRLDEDGEEAGQVHGQAHHCTRSRPLLSRTLTKEKKFISIILLKGSQIRNTTFLRRQNISIFFVTHHKNLKTIFCRQKRVHYKSCQLIYWWRKAWRYLDEFPGRVVLHELVAETGDAEDC